MGLACQAVELFLQEQFAIVGGQENRDFAEGAFPPAVGRRGGRTARLSPDAEIENGRSA